MRGAVSAVFFAAVFVPALSAGVPQAPEEARPTSLVSEGLMSAFQCPTTALGTAGQSNLARPLPIAPLAARLCVLGKLPAKKFPHRPAGGVALGPGPAGVLATLFDSAPRANAAASRCAASRTEEAILLEFFYPHEERVAVEVVSAGCSQPVAFLAGHARRLDETVAGFLTAATANYFTPGHGTPDLFGESVSQASRTAKRLGFSLQFGGEEIDPHVPADVVLLQNPLAGGAKVFGKQIDVVMSAHPASACSTGELALNYYGGGAGAGNDFGTILIRDVGSKPCLLRGPIGVVGTDAAGRDVTHRISYPVSPGLVLSSRAPRVPVGVEPPVDEVVGELILSAEYRDGPYPPSYLCVGHYVIPTFWRLSFSSGAVTVRNASRDPGYPAFSSLRTCKGELNSPGTVAAE